MIIIDQIHLVAFSICKKNESFNLYSTHRIIIKGYRYSVNVWNSIIIKTVTKSIFIRNNHFNTECYDFLLYFSLRLSKLSGNVSCFYFSNSFSFPFFSVLPINQMNQKKKKKNIIVSVHICVYAKCCTRTKGNIPFDLHSRQIVWRK